MVSGITSEHRAESDEDLAKRFAALAAKWEEETRFTSKVKKMREHPAYREIVGMGEKAIPLLLADLEKNGGFVFLALAEITRANPVPKESVGKIDEIGAAWIAWDAPMATGGGMLSSQRDFPNLHPDNHRKTSDSDDRYNCIAWAAGRTDKWWDPAEPTEWEANLYWPENAARDYKVTSLAIRLRVSGIRQKVHQGTRGGVLRLWVHLWRGVRGETEGYIHVHHLVPLSEVNGEYIVDPVKDLRPVCPNCHAVITLGGALRSVDAVKKLLRKTESGRRKRRQEFLGPSPQRKGS